MLRLVPNKETKMKLKLSPNLNNTLELDISLISYTTVRDQG